jgi:hypothetical protein
MEEKNGSTMKQYISYSFTSRKKGNFVQYSHKICGTYETSQLTEWSKIRRCFIATVFNFILEYSIRKVQEKQVELTLNGSHQLLAYADEVNLLGYNTDIIKKTFNIC